MKLRRLTHLSVGIFAAFALSPITGHSADDAQNAGVQSGKLSAADEKFVLKAAQGGMTEVQVGELAKQKGKRADVKQFGDRMIADHSRANDELKALASKKGLTLPGQLDAVHAGVVDRLSKLEGDQFDKAYIDDMAKDHKEDVSEFEEEARNAKDADLKAFVTKALPVLKSHLQHILKVSGESGK